VIQNAADGKIDMFNGSFKKKKPNKTEELKSYLKKYDTSKTEIGNQLDFIKSQYMTEHYDNRHVGNRGVGAVKFDRTTGRESKWSALQ